MRRPRFRWRDLPAWFAALVVVFVVLSAITAPIAAPADPAKQNLLGQFELPSLEHPFGTDDLGRDVLSRIMWGSQVAVQVGLISVGIAVAVGVPIGLIAGYNGRWVDAALMRVMDGLLAFPPILLAMAVVAGLGPGIRNAMIAIGVVFLPTFARLSRSSALVARESDYVLAARTLGASPQRIIAQHILPNIVAPIVVQGSVSVGIAVIVEASLAYLGLGSQPPDPSWGVMLRQASSFFQQHWFVTVPPGLAVFLFVLSLNLLGDHLRDILDPRLRGAR